MPMLSIAYFVRLFYITEVCLKRFQQSLTSYIRGLAYGNVNMMLNVLVLCTTILKKTFRMHLDFQTLYCINNLTLNRFYK